MCGNLFKSPKTQTVEVEKVADPAPTAITPTDAGVGQDRMDAEAKRQRNKRGYAATRIAPDRSVLTDNTQGAAGRQTLG